MADIAREAQPGLLRCVVVTPERAVLDEPAEFVALPMYDGELGVLRGRAPLIGRLGYGELRIRRGTETKRYFVDGGFAQVRADVVSVLTQQAIRAEDIDQSAATRSLEAPSTSTANPEAREAEQKSKQRARAQLRVARQGLAPTH